MEDCHGRAYSNFQPTIEFAKNDLVVSPTKKRHLKHVLPSKPEFGAAIRSTSTGIVINNEMDDFSIPTDISPEKLPPAPTNFIEPRKRPLSSMTPIIITKVLLTAQEINCLYLIRYRLYIDMDTQFSHDKLMKNSFFYALVG
jgi:hypothetical protein